MDPQVGQLIHNKYRLVRLIGEGGMGSVWEAHHELLGTRVALKFLHAHLGKRSGLVDRFVQEAQVSARIRSPHVVNVSDVDRTADGVAFMVMELIEGESLQTRYEQLAASGQRLEYGEAFGILLQIVDGVAAAHRLGIVHRDLKPDNVMLTRDAAGRSQVKILDFGIAKLKAGSEGDRALTRPGVVMGTPEYMAPEQAFSADRVDARADVFSLGVIVFEMLAGHRPVSGDNPVAIAAKYLNGEVPRLRDVRPTIAEGLSDAVGRAMGGRPEERFGSIDEFRAAIEAFAPEGAVMRPATNVNPTDTGATPPPVAPMIPTVPPGAPIGEALGRTGTAAMPAVVEPPMRAGGTQVGAAGIPYAASPMPGPVGPAPGVHVPPGAYGYPGMAPPPAVGNPGFPPHAGRTQGRGMLGILGIAAGLTALVVGGVFLVQRMKSGAETSAVEPTPRREAGVTGEPANPSAGLGQAIDAPSSTEEVPAALPPTSPNGTSTGAGRTTTSSGSGAPGTAPSAAPTGAPSTTPNGNPWMIPTALPEIPGIPTAFPSIPGLSFPGIPNPTGAAGAPGSTSTSNSTPTTQPTAPSGSRPTFTKAGGRPRFGRP